MTVQGGGAAGHLHDSDELLPKAYDHRIMMRLLRYLSPFKWRILLAFTFSIVSAGSSLAGPYIIKLAIDNLVSGGSFQYLDIIAFVFIGNSLISWGSTYGQTYTVNWIGQNILLNLRTEIFHHLQRLSLSFFDKNAVGRLMSLIQNDVSALNELLSQGIINIASDVLVLIGIIAVMFSMDVRLSMLTFIVLPVMFIITAIWQGRARAAYRDVRHAIARVNTNLQESLSGVRVVQSFTREERNMEYFEQINRDNFQANLSAAKLSAIFMPASDLLNALATALVIGFGGFQVLQGELTAGALVAFTLYINRFFDPIRDLTMRYDTMQSAMAAGERIFEILDTEPDVPEVKNPVRLADIKGEVKFKNVTFAYLPEIDVLKNISLHIRPGESVAFVGQTGAGKTTITNILSRFYDIREGQILIDGIDLRRISLPDLRSRIGTVLQEPFLFSSSIMDNIRYGRLDATDEEVMEAAKAVGAHEFIMRLQDGYNTNVQERGIKLSVGQRQLVSFARAILADPRILILDEATSSVDTETERVIQQAMVRLLKGRTSLVIAHRLSTIRNADRIVVLDRGEIAETGSHEELMARQGTYHRLYTLGFRQVPETAESIEHSP